MLCTAIATVIRIPSACPSAKAEPTPMPSAAEWTVMTPTISTALRASSPGAGRRRCRGGRRAAAARARRRAAEHPPARCADAAVGRLDASPRLAPSITPAAIALATPSTARRPSGRKQRQRPEPGRERGDQGGEEDGGRTPSAPHGTLAVMDAVEVLGVARRLREDGGGYQVVHASPGLELGVYVLVAPEPDRQQPHDLDEVYVVLEGSGRPGDRRTPGAARGGPGRLRPRGRRAPVHGVRTARRARRLQRPHSPPVLVNVSRGFVLPDARVTVLRVVMTYKRPRIPALRRPGRGRATAHEAREAAGLSQRELAFPGCSAAYISRIERGERIPSLQVMRELARRTGVSEAFLARGRETLDGEVAPTSGRPRRPKLRETRRRARRRTRLSPRPPRGRPPARSPLTRLACRRSDVAVVGAGINGVAAALALARAGRSVVPLEQFAIGHDRGSSHGSSRIFRLSYADPYYVRAPRAGAGRLACARRGVRRRAACGPARWTSAG